MMPACICRSGDAIKLFAAVLSGLFLERPAASQNVRSLSGPGCRWRAQALSAAGTLALLLVLPVAALATPGVVFQGSVRILDTGSISPNTPWGVVVDSSGNLYIGDTFNNQIIKIDALGNASVLAVTGLSPAMSHPTALALDSAGNLYVADSNRNRILKVDRNGAATVVSMSGLTLFSPEGLAFDPAGNLYVSDSGNDRIIKIPAAGTAAVFNITGLGTPLFQSTGVGTDSAGNLYIADGGNSRIVMVTPGGAGSAVAFSGLSTSLNIPFAVSIDRLGNLFVADAFNDRIVERLPGGASFALSTGTVSLTSPRGVVVDPNGNLYITSTFSNQIVSLAATSVGFGHVPLGSSSGTTLALPFHVPAGSMLTSIQVLTDGTPSLDFQADPGSTCASGTTNTTCSVDVKFLPLTPGLHKGAVVLNYIITCLTFSLTVPVYGFADAPVAALNPGAATVLSTTGPPITTPFQIAVDGAGNMYVASYTGSTVVKFPAGGGAGTTVDTGSFTLTQPTGVAVDGAGNLFIADYGNSRIVQVPASGSPAVFSISGLSQPISLPTALAFDGAGNLYIADYGNGRVVEVTRTGVGGVLDTGSFSFSGFDITGMSVDANGNVYIADRTNTRIIKVSAAGAATLVPVPGLTLNNPQGVAVDPSGNLYIVDSGNQRIIRSTTAGNVSVIKFSGAIIGSFVFGITPDATGNLLIADWNNSRIVKVDVSATSLAFATANVGSTSSDSPKTATVTNLGDATLLFAANPSYTVNFSQNTSDTNLCASSTTLTPGTACDVSVKFTPQSGGTLTTNVTLTDNHLNVAGSVQQVAVSGTGVVTADATAVGVTTTPASAVVGESISITATVTDTAAGHTATIPTGSVAFTDTIGGNTSSLNGGNSVTLDSAGKATIIGVTLSIAGTHTIGATYAGVANSFLTSTNTATISLTTQITPTITWAQPTAILFGATLSGVLNAAAANSGTAVPGTFAYTATLQSGSPAAVTVATQLAAGNYTMNTTFTPTDTTTYHSATGSVTLSVQDFTLGVANVGAGSGATSDTVTRGGLATYTLAFGPSGTTFPAAVVLTVSGLPPGATATLTPSTIPAGSGATNVTLAIQTTFASAHATPSAPFFDRTLSPAAFAVILLPFAGLLRRKVRYRPLSPGSRRGVATLLFIFVCGAAVASLCGCGSTSSGYLAQRSQTFTVTVTATSGTLSHATSVSLTVN
jgi:sugar lactone lactonase YvrE